MQSSDSEQEKEFATPQGGSESPPNRFSLHGLSAAFARLTGARSPQPSVPAITEPLEKFADTDVAKTTVGEVVSPRRIIEGMLFVGNSEGQPLTNRQLAANIRDVSPKEVDKLIEEINQSYRDTGTTYEIVSAGAGYRMHICQEFDALRHRFGGRVREAKLTPPTIEVLSVVAYRQPITAEEVRKLRGARSHALLSQLVRRGLLRLEHTADAPRKPTYHTTERFNHLFRIDSYADLPSSEDLDDM